MTVRLWNRFYLNTSSKLFFRLLCCCLCIFVIFPSSDMSYVNVLYVCLSVHLSLVGRGCPYIFIVQGYWNQFHIGSYRSGSADFIFCSVGMRVTIHQFAAKLLQTSFDSDAVLHNFEWLRQCVMYSFFIDTCRSSFTEGPLI